MVGDCEVEIFSKGSQVEVSSDEDGFKGSWFIATILEPPPNSKSGSKKKKHHRDAFFVEYKSLFADDEGSQRLREHVQASFIRPLPPEIETDDGSFELNDVVDAFYRDGWWTGVVTGVVGNSRFRVFFQNPPEEGEFVRKDLRMHQEWVDGKWVRAEKQRTTGFNFSTGAAVEVNLGKENSRDVWFPATVCKEIGINSFLVNYQGSRNGDEASILEATVDSFCIRPSPPDLGDKNFELLEKVDAFFDFGWWSGIITRVHAGRRYTVFFKQINKDMELSHSELRPHMDWTDGKWHNGSQEVIITSNHQEQLGQACNNSNDTEMATVLEMSGASKNSTEEKTTRSTNSRKSQIEKSSPCSEKSHSYVATSSKKKIKHVDHSSDGSLSRPSKKLKEGIAAEAPLPLTACQSRTIPFETSTKEALAGSATPTTGGMETMGGMVTNCSEQPLVDDRPSKTTKIRLWRKKADTSVLSNQQTDLVKRRGGRARQSSLVKSPLVSASGKDGHGGELEVLAALEVMTQGMRGSQAKDFCQSPSEEDPKLMRDQKETAISKSMELKKQREGGVKTQVKRRGRPRKLVIIDSPEVLVAGEKHNGAGGAADEMVVEDCKSDEVELPEIEGVESTDMKLFRGRKKLLNNPARHDNIVSSIIRIPFVGKEKLLNEKVVQVSGKQVERRPSKRGRKRSISINGDLPTQESQDASQEKTAEVNGTHGTTNEVEMAIVELSNNTADDDRPLSMWFEGRHSPTTMDDSRHSIGRSVEARKRQDGSAMQPCAILATADNVQKEIQALPFVKTSPIWKTIESLEVFKMTPQKPHFHPLDKCKEAYREGLAIGSMVTFASLVEKISKFQFDDPRSIIDSSLETLLNLEMHGFDVNVVRGRLNELLSIKDRQGKLCDQSKEAERQILEHNQEKTKIDDEINDIDKKIRDLQEKRAMAVSMKESKDSEIAALRSNVDVIKEGIQNAHFDFERIVAAPL
ncbi:hypothetical protein L1049_004038 [Liquidambar formosana]|uniref:Agenet domain-containing protein n=1 Tax=Liquidambar formosana TaxID=63359 RepID=A0AAP0RMS7_LIQFO